MRRMVSNEMTSTTLVDSIFESCDYSSDGGHCVRLIRGDLEAALKPIVEALLDGHPLEAEALKQAYADTDLAASLRSAVWPNGNKDEIPRMLRAALEPTARFLEDDDSAA